MICSIGMEGTVPLRVQMIPVRTLAVEVLEGPDAGTRYQSDLEVITVGGAEGNALRLKDRTVSRFHAELVRSAAGVVLVDLASTNGTRIGALRVTRATVPPGSVISFGSTVGGSSKRTTATR